jgi:hypothetical protein
MSQRNPLNERYQQREGGKTRKSAASAKPATKAASTVYIADPNAKPKKSFLDRFKKQEEPVKMSKSQQKKAAEAADQQGKKKGKWTLNDMEGSEKMESTEGLSEETKKAARKKYLNPGTKEYKRWRTIWWIVIACGVISLIPPVLAPQYFVDNATMSMVFFGLGYAFLIAAVAIDAIKIRPLRKAARGGSIKEDRSKEATAARKQAKKEAIAKEEAKAAKKASRKRS